MEGGPQACGVLVGPIATLGSRQEVWCVDGAPGGWSISCGCDHTRLGSQNGADILILNDSNYLYQQEPGEKIPFAQIPVTLGTLLSPPDIKPSCFLLY